MQGVINVVNRFAHPAIWNANEINAVLIQVDTLHNDCGGHIDWPLAERMIMARMAEHCEDTRNEVIKGTQIVQEFNLFRDTSEELWQTLKTHAQEDCRRASLAVKGSGLTRSDTNAILLNHETEFTAVAHSGDKVAPSQLERHNGQRERMARQNDAPKRPAPMQFMADPPPAPPNPDHFDQRKRQKRAQDPPNMTCIRCGVRGHTAHRCNSAWCSIPAAAAWTMRMKLKAIYIRAAAKIYNIHFEDRSDATTDEIIDALRRYGCRASNNAKQEQPPPAM